MSTSYGVLDGVAMFNWTSSAWAAVPPGASLDLNFMAPGTSIRAAMFTRASTATYFGATGTMQTAAVNAPRWDYDPVTHALRGLLIEEARTNYVIQSGAMAAAPWAQANNTRTPNVVAAPDGTVSGAMFIENFAASVQHFITNTIAGPSVNGPLTASIYIQDLGRQYAQLWLLDNTTLTNFVHADIDLTAGTVGAPVLGGAATAGASSIRNVGGGWYLVSVTATLSAAATTGAVHRTYLCNTPGNNTSTHGKRHQRPLCPGGTNRGRRLPHQLYPDDSGSGHAGGGAGERPASQYGLLCLAQRIVDG